MIASRTCIAEYAGLLLGERTILYGIANNSLKVDCFRNQYRRVRMVTATVLHGITNIKTCIDGYAGLLLGGHTILSGIANSSPRLIASRTCITGYAGLLLVGRKILHGIANNSLSVLLGGRTMLYRITNNSLKVDCFRNQYRRVCIVTATVLHGITNTKTCIDGYAGLLLGGHTLLSGIANSSPRVIASRTCIAGYC